ncbi:DUF3489 domain-containing protein [Burkholderia multivorans]|nr:DUF3489 domain-containing protein [Burkholderia multivorans]
MSTNLTTTQREILAHAVQQSDGRINWFPDNIKGGARKKVLDALFNRALITTDGTDWFVAAEGYDALGVVRPGAISAPAPTSTPVRADDPELEAAVAAAEASFAAVKAQPRVRENSKQAMVIRMLRRPEGATIAQICEATGWQSHTVRGTLAGALKKKLGLNVTSDKQGEERIYRIAD